MFDRIILNIPHSSPLFPFGKDGWDDGIETELSRWTDWYTDWIFQSVDARIISVSYPFSRFFCDVERLEDDPLENVGQGIVYKRFNSLKRNISDYEESWAKKTYYDHLERLCSFINDNRVLLLDCHSFPSDLSDVDICIGFNDDWSRPSEEITDIVIRTFTKTGYNVGVNSPYSNSITPSCKYGYKSLMIELNKSIYIDDHNRLIVDKAEEIKKIINDIYGKLLYD